MLGKTLHNDQSVGSLNIRESTPLVLMITKPITYGYEAPEVNTSPSSSSTPLPIFTRDGFTAPEPPANPIPSTSSSTPEPSRVPLDSIFNRNQWMLESSTLGTVSESSVNELVDMGFERDQAVKALKASFGNTERAVEYLTTSIPENPVDGSSSFPSNPFPSHSFSPNPFSSNTFSSNPFSSDSFSSFGSGSSTFRPFGMSSMSSSFMGPRPTEMVGHIEEVDLNEPEEPSKSVESEPTSLMEDIIPSEPAPSDAVSAASPLNDAAITSTPAQAVASTSTSSFAPTHLVSEPSSSVISRPTPSTSEFSFTSSQAMGFSEISAFSEPSSSSGEEPITLESLKNDPMVHQIRELMAQNPDLSGPLLEQLIQSKPQVMQIMVTNPTGLAMLFCGGRGSSSTQSTTISVTREEREVFDRIEGLGFPRSMAIQAYFACDKNEELAINYLAYSADD